MRRAGFRAGKCPDRARQIGSLRQRISVNPGPDECGLHFYHAPASDVMVDGVADYPVFPKGYYLALYGVDPRNFVAPPPLWVYQ